MGHHAVYGWWLLFSHIEGCISRGPTIRATQGNTVIVELKNNLLTENVAIHWHGIRQIGTPWFDGSEGVTQCPILPGDTFTYEFVVDRAEDWELDISISFKFRNRDNYNADNDNGPWVIVFSSLSMLSLTNISDQAIKDYSPPESESESESESSKQRPQCSYVFIVTQMIRRPRPFFVKAYQYQIRLLW
ncbi:hypothetical protein POM88_054488 [Heracleum sosnowskyi]|uniref:Plastocyanin-like domain-containing protein n=1 Tax=Heracleum sosnowskyi TaxID=360622 RepID=A0AAD8LW60_9APIA|nr:hypothetical protein POM88_054488 [Heracleum sosnowskyi]